MENNKKASLFDLFWTFFKIGAFTFGGGYAMLPLIEREVVENKNWVTQSDMFDMVVIAESTPGVLAVNMATSCGFKKRGVFGAVLATLGVILPSFLIILALSFLISQYESDFWFRAAFSGIQICVCTLIFNAFLKVSKSITKDIFNYLLVVASFATALFTNFNVIFVILIGAALGLLVSTVKNKKGKNNNQLPIENSLENGQNEQKTEVFDCDQPQDKEDK